MAGAIASGGRLKDRYRLERTLGRGGMAAVWLGHDETLDRPVAVKVLSDTIASDPGFVARFRREAHTAAGLSHPNVVGVYDFSDEGERPYLVMQLVPGETLASRLERGQHVDCDQLAGELLDALSHIHRVGILHRDVKPANIVVEPSGTAKLIDFGIALPRDATSLTSTGLVLGTERYLAPEVMEGQPASERSDLYSCGLVLQLCKGQRSPALEALIAAMTSKDARDRPPSAAQALKRLERPSPAAEGPTEVLDDPPVAGPTERLPASRWKLAATILGLVATATIVALAAAGGGGDPAADGGRQAAPAAQEPSSPAPSDEAAGGGSAQTAAVPEAVGSDPARGAALNEQGFT
ncbi:MAG TPA: serine/threonine-protein kinase, partial [Solirubrobacterales bacterium]|nr:serine/threonine-protein kinase [Solirubrobacterales bacterium]